MARLLTGLLGLWIGFSANAAPPAGGLWNELKTRRAMLPGAHQEFEISQTYKLPNGSSQAGQRQIVVDMAQAKWREISISGSGKRIRIFDGTNLLTMEEGGDEFMRAKRRPKDQDPVPPPYDIDLEWQKASEIERRPCDIPGRADLCAVLDVPVKLWTRNAGSSMTRLRQGTARLVLDVENGLILSIHTLEAIDNQRGGYQSETIYTLKRFGDGAAPEASLFKVPAANLREVKQLSPWNAARIKKQLGGSPAPELTATDISGKPVVLSAFKGRTVLLDFFTTWCPPCRADAPALDKLFRKYGAQELMIVGVSVSEERAVVESFLKEHPHSFPVVLTTENEIPRPYEVGEFPTYIIIDRDGTVASAVEGDQGFSELQKLLKKAGLEVD
jgi:thiol-disulfide isomerase/thioredoxin